MINVRRLCLLVSAVLLPLAVVLLLVSLSSVVSAHRDETAFYGPDIVPPARAPASATSQLSYVFRFDPAQESFETFTIPTSGAKPQSIAVMSGGSSQDVWFTETETDKIGRLIYTDTQDYTFREYDVTPGGEPLQLVVDNDRKAVWFTERSGNRIGRIAVGTDTYAAFNIGTPESYPSGIDLAPDGSVWFSETGADKIAHLVVTSTTDYRIDEFPINGTAAGAYGVEDQSLRYVWFAETATGRLTRFNTAQKRTDIFVSLGQDSYPFDISYDAGLDYLWVTEFGDNQIAQVELTTNHLLNTFNVPSPGGSPRGLAQVGSNHFWFTEYAFGRITRLVYTATQDFRFDAFPLPVEGLYVADVAADDVGAIWVVAFQPYQVRLALIANNYNDGPPAGFGIQMYGNVNYNTGLSEVAAAGAQWIRAPIKWRSAEPTNVTPDKYKWRSIDAQVAAIIGEGIEPLLTIGGNPEWAAVYPMGPVTDVANLTEFVGALVERYDGDGIDDAPGSPVVRYLEMYNEPDLADEWRAERGGYGYFGYNGDAYAAVLDAIYPVIKAANPKTQLVFGGLSSDNFDFEGGPTDPNFTDEVLANCNTRCFDVMNFHYFPYFRFRWEKNGKDIIGKAEFLRSKMAEYGFERPIMCTETTWYGATTWGSESLQTRYVIVANVRGMAADFVLTNWFAWKDVDSGLPGLLDAQLRPKPAYFAYQTLTTQLGEAIYQRALSIGESGDAEIEGYVFSVPGPDGWERRDVVWLDCASLRLVPPEDCVGESRTMTIAAGVLQVTSKSGATSIVRDADDGRIDGLVSLTITPDPIFIDHTP